MSNMMVIEDFIPNPDFQIVENKSRSRYMKIRGVFGKSDTINENKRIYPKMVMENAVNKLQPAIREGKVCGTIDHPPTPKVQLKEASHLLTDLYIESNGTVIGEAKILNTMPGIHLQELIKGGMKLGVSSRGYGKTKINEKGITEVCNNFVLSTYDIVQNPSFGTYPELMESKWNNEGWALTEEGIWFQSKRKKKTTMTVSKLLKEKLKEIKL